MLKENCKKEDCYDQFEDFWGWVRHIQAEHPEQLKTCEICKGKGYIEDSIYRHVFCDTCEGNGKWVE